MAAEVLNELICRKISPEDLITWLTTNNLVDCPAALKQARCSREDFVPYFLNFLREQTARISQLSSFPTPGKAHRMLQERKNNGKSRQELFPPVQNDSADISLGMKSLEIAGLSYTENYDGCNRKTADVTKRKMVAISPGRDLGVPIAQSSPVQEQRRSTPDTWQRSFSLQDFIVKGTRSGKKKSTGGQERMLPSSGNKESKSCKRINPTPLSSGKSRGGHGFLGLTSRSCEPSASFCEQPIETSNSKDFEEERTLLRKERLRQRFDNKQATLSPTKVVASCINEFIVAEPDLVSCSEQLQVLADVYSRLMNCNLVLNIMAELCFVVGLLVIRVPVGFGVDELCLSHRDCDENAIDNLGHRGWKRKKCTFFCTVHNCVYFAMLVLDRQRQILECFDKVTLKMLADNRHTSVFMPDLYDFINGLLATSASKTRRSAFLVVANQGNVSFQSDTDNRQNFPTDQAFHVFRKQRDGLYEILRIWEANHMSPDWSYAVALGPRIRTLVNLHNEPANFVHFARLFRSQLLGTCNGYTGCDELATFNDSGGGSLNILKEVHPEKLSRLRERLVTPIQSGSSCSLPSFPGQQEFYRDFILHSSHPTFLQHLSDSLASELLALNETSFMASDLEDADTYVDDTTRSSYLTCMSALRLLAKFLGLITFLPYQSKAKVLPDNMVASHSAVRAELCPQLDIMACIKRAVQAHRLVLTTPWVVKYLSMMDRISAHLPYYRAVFEQLFCIYQDVPLSGRPSLLIRLLLGWLFESPNFPEKLLYAWKLDPSMNNTSEPGESSQVVPLDGLDVVDEHCLYLCCPYMGELKICLSVGMGSSGRTVKHITPISASLNKPSAAKQIQLQLEESFFHGQPASTRKTVEYVAERVASCSVKHICNKLLPSVKQQGAADVEHLISASTILDAVNSGSETAIKELKESLLREVTAIADRCCSDFRHKCDVVEYCKHRCQLALPVLLADDVLKPVCTMSAQIAARLSQERVNTWIQSHITPGLFLKDFQLDVEKSFRNVGKVDHKNESLCKSSHVVSPRRRSVKHLDVIESPARAVMQIRELMWELLDGDGCAVSEERVLVTLNIIQDTLCNRADLIPSVERLLPSLVVDLALLLVTHRPDMMTTGLMDHFVSVWHTVGECEDLTHLLCPRNVLLLSQSKQAPGKVWVCLAELLAHLLSCGILLPDTLEQQCVALLQSTWPQSILNLIASCMQEVMRLYGTSKDYKFTLLMEWLSEMCSDIAFFN